MPLLVPALAGGGSGDPSLGETELALVKSGVEWPLGERPRLELALLWPAPSEGDDAGKGAETPSAFANLANFCGESGARGMRAASAITGLCGAEPSVLRFGIAGAVKGETYSPVAGG